MQGDYQKQARRIIPLFFLGFFMLLMVSYFLSHSLLIVNRPSNSNDSTLVLKKEGSSEAKKIGFGTHVLPNGKYSVEVSSGLSQNLKNTEIKTLHIARVSGDISPQKQARKIARGASDCLFGDIKDVEEGSIFSYSCSGALYIFRSQFKDFSRKEILRRVEETSLDNPLPFKGGIVSLGSGEGGNNLVYLDARTQKIYPLKDTVGDGEIKSYRLAVSESRIYILDTSNSTVFVFDSPSAKPLKIKLERNRGISTSLSSFKVFKDHLYLFSAEGQQPDSEDSFKKGILYVYPLNSTNPSQTIEVKKNADDMMNFSVLNDSLIYSSSVSQSLSVYKLGEGRLHSLTTIPNTSGSAAVGGDLYVIIGGYIYKYSPEKELLSLEFGSQRIIVNKVLNIGSKLIFNGVAKNETSPANQTYILEPGQPLSNNYRLEDHIPYTDIELPISWMDYFDNKIYVVLSLDSLRNDPAKGHYVFDQAEFDSKSKIVKDRLKKDGFTGANYNIKIAPY